ncbi:hypothetical protein PG995_003548 [Apiospora arundinis]
MAGTSPTRRSSRARTTQPQSQHSSSASSASGRAERTTRAFTKNGSPQKSTGSGSLSSEPPEDSTATTASTDDIAPFYGDVARVSKTKIARSSPRANTSTWPIQVMTTRYRRTTKPFAASAASKTTPAHHPSTKTPRVTPSKIRLTLNPSSPLTSPKTWAGFLSNATHARSGSMVSVSALSRRNPPPDNYYCEQCRRDLHKIYTASNGQKYSIYLPIHRPSRSTSRAASAATHGTRSPKGNERKSSRASASAAAAAASHKRRSTMNSRDAAYDEEEQLRRAIEASKEDAIPEELEAGGRRPKRGRDDEEESSESIIKRQRTNSKSPSPSADQAPIESREESEDESSTRNGVSKKSSRNNVRNQREKTERDERREEQERKRVEAANKRKGRAERRRADGMTTPITILVVRVRNANFEADIDSDPSDEMPSSTRAAVSRTTESAQPPDLPMSSQPAPDTPPANPPPSASHKKKAAPQHRKKGRNQYTKDRDGHDHDDSPARSMSRDIARNQDDHGVTHTKSSINESHNKHTNAKAKGGMSSKITMSDLKRRANNILEFISRTQVELANEPLSEKNSPRHETTDDRSAIDMPPIQVNGAQASDEKDCMDILATKPPTSLVPLKDFKDMSCVEMMDSLTRDLVKWQKEFAT